MRVVAILIALLLSACVTDGPQRSEDYDPVEASRINTQLGVNYMRKVYDALAQEKLERAIEQDDRNGMAYAALAFLNSRIGEVAQADRYYKRALSLDGENPDIQNNYGSYLCGQQRREEGEKLLLKAAQNPRFASPAAAWANAGVCVRNLAPQRAERYLREALRLNPEFPDALAQMAWLHYDRGDFLKSRAFLQRFEVVGKHLPETLWLAAQTERRLGDVDAARRYAIALRTQYPESEEAYDLGQNR